VVTFKGIDNDTFKESFEFSAATDLVQIVDDRTRLVHLYPCKPVASGLSPNTSQRRLPAAPRQPGQGLSDAQVAPVVVHTEKHTLKDNEAGR
jgi:hypothetical protein